MSNSLPKTQLTIPIQPPFFPSKRRLFEQQLTHLHKCSHLPTLKKLHTLIIKQNLHTNPFIAPKLISAFALCHKLNLSHKVFSQLTNPNSHSFNALIKAHVANNDPVKAFAVFNNMRLLNVWPDNYTYLYLLKCFSSLRFVEMIHCHVEKMGFWYDLFVPNSLIDAYSKCGVLGVKSAKALFDGMGERDVVSYNCMISGLLKVGELEEGRRIFDEMPGRDRISWNAILDGYVKAGEMDIAFELFERMPGRDVVSWSTLLSGYAKLGDMDMARMMFDRMPVKNLVSWTIIISGYAEKGLVKQAMVLYDEMEKEGVRLDNGTYISILSASAETGLLCLGRRVHQSIKRNKDKCNVLVDNALVDMYGKCGSLKKAMFVFNSIKRKDIVSWNSMIHGLAMHGYGIDALQLFVKMQEEGFSPDKVTFVGVLSACSHSGMIDEGICYFYSMEKDYGIRPEIEHYGCMIDLLGRGGRLNEAFIVLQDMPFEPNVVIWGSLLTACRIHNNLGLAEEALKQLVRLEPTNKGHFLALSSICATVGDWGSVSTSRLEMKKMESKRPSGVSLIELNGELNEFTVMDSTHPKAERIYETVNGLGRNLKRIAIPLVVPA